MKRLRVPTLSQKNETHDNYIQSPELAKADGVDIGSSLYSKVWCGRTAASMVYNYFKQVQQHVLHLDRDASQFIRNNETPSEGALDLIYPDGGIACHNGGNRIGDYFHLYEPLNRALAEIRGLGDGVWGSTPPAAAWRQRTLLSDADRRAHAPGEGDVAVFTDGDVRALLADVIDSIDRNTPVLAYTGLSKRRAPKHIVVLSGYEERPDGLWLHIDDPSTMVDREGEMHAEDLADLLEPNEAMANVLEVEDAGVWGERGATYWLKATRLFEAHQHSPNETDLWGDYATKEGLTVWIHDTLVTPDSPYVREIGRRAAFPVDLTKGIEVTDETIAWAYTITEQTNDGGYFPIGANLAWHGGLHFPNLDPTATVHALFPGTIVAARLGPPDASASGPARHRNNHYGSDRFILMRHDARTVFRGVARGLGEAEHPLTGPSFFTLVMHVGGIAWDETERLQDYRWLLSDRVATVRTTRRTPYARRPAVTSASAGAGVVPEGWTFTPTGTRASLDSAHTWYTVATPSGATRYLRGDYVEAVPATEQGDATGTHRTTARLRTRPIPSTTDVPAAGVLPPDTVLEVVTAGVDGPWAPVPEGWLRVRLPEGIASEGIASEGIASDGTASGTIEDDTEGATRHRNGGDLAYVQAHAVEICAREPDAELVRALRDGEIATFPEATAPRVRAGDVIAPMGVFGHRGILRPGEGDPLIHVEVFSAGDSSLYALLDAALDSAHRAAPPAAGDGAPRGATPHGGPSHGGPPAFEWAEAVGGDAVQAPEAIARILREPATATRAAKVDRIRGPDAVTYAGRDLLAATFWQRAGELTPEEVQWFFAYHPNAVRLRAYACRFAGEWVAMPEVFNMFSNGDAEALAWWGPVAEAIDDLPADGHTWTYNPIRVLQLATSSLRA